MRILGAPLFVLCSVQLAVEASWAECARVVTLSPALTEVAYALGLGPRVVGVSRFVDVPAEAKQKPAVGGLLDPNIERILSLQPDAIFAQEEQVEALQALRRVGAPLFIHNHQTVRGILESIRLMGERCGVRSAAEQLLSSLEAGLSRVRAARRRDAPRVMVVIAEDAGTSIGGSFWVSGGDGFYAELLTIAGGENINRGNTVGMATLSMEGVLQLRPEVVIMITTPGLNVRAVTNQFATSWKALFPTVPMPRVHGFEGSYAWVPGPRVVQLLEDVQRAISEVPR